MNFLEHHSFSGESKVTRSSLTKVMILCLGEHTLRQGFSFLLLPMALCIVTAAILMTKNNSVSYINAATELSLIAVRSWLAYAQKYREIYQLRAHTWSHNFVMRYSVYTVFTVVVLCLLLSEISTVAAQRRRGRLRGRPSRIYGCRYAGYHRCCTRGSCYVPRGNCYCDVKCHKYRDCCFDILTGISCGGCIVKGCPLGGGCCRKPYPRCYSRPGKCWCDKWCHYLKDCCEDIYLIGCFKGRRRLSIAAAKRNRGRGRG